MTEGLSRDAGAWHVDGGSPVGLWRADDLVHQAGVRNLRIWAIIGAAATIIIGLLLLFGLA
jgi:hypothetical protein